MYEKYLEQLEEAGKIRNLKERSITCYKTYVSYFLKYQGRNPEQLTCQDVRAFTYQMEEIAKKYGLDLDGEWNKDLLPHQGRHPNEYHEYIYIY